LKLAEVAAADSHVLKADDVTVHPANRKFVARRD
jgi:hypothetical protein